LLEWGQDIFNSAELELIWRPKDEHIILSRDGVPVSKCGILKQTISVNGETLQVGGIGGVVTAPASQHKGYAHKVLKEAVKILKYEWQMPAAMLFCLEPLVSFYRQPGWTLITPPVTLVQPAGVVQCPVQVMVKPLQMARFPDTPVHVEGLPW